MRVFTTSDTHFGHFNIIKFCSRPFGSLESMNMGLEERWNSAVSAEDTVYFLGDFAAGKDATPTFVANTLHRLNGSIKVVEGNHDQAVKKYKTPSLYDIVEQYGLGHKVEFMSNVYDFHYEGTHFAMCHYPMNDWNGKFRGAVHLHGHKHNGYSASRAREQTAKRRYNIGVDMYGGPVQITGDCRFLNEPKGWN